jgi:outer membrane protein
VTKSAAIRLSLILIFEISGAINSFAQQTTVVQRPAVTTVPVQSRTAANPSSQVQQQQGMLPPYYAYPYGSETTTSRSLTAQQAVSLALDHASSLKTAQYDEQSAAEDVKQARTALLPEFTVPLTYIGTTPSPIRDPGEPRSFSYVSADAINHTVGLVNMTGTIDIAGRLRASLHRANALLAAAHAGTLAARRSLLIATIDAYYGLVLTRQRARLADEALALAESFVAVTEEQQKRGVGEEADVWRARSSARSRRDELAQAQLNESIAMSQLRILTGVDYSTYINVASISEDVPQITDLLGYEESAIMLRPELMQLDAQKHAAIEEARAARRELWPQLTYTVNGGFDAADFHPLSRYSGGSALVSLDVPIFNFGASKSREAQARLRGRSLDAQRENEVLQLKQEFYAARAGALSAWDRIRYTRQAATAAQLSLSSIFERYRSKDATLLDVIDAESNYSATRLEYYQAIADYHSSRARLEIDPLQMFGKPVAPVIQPETKVPPPCTLGRQQAPKIDSLYLGMTDSQMKQLVPGIQISAANDVGVTHAELNGVDVSRLAASSSFFNGVAKIRLEFTDGRLSFIRVDYPETANWSGNYAFLSAMAPKFSVEGEWKPFYDWQNKDVRYADDLRDLGIECEGFRLSLGIGLEGVANNQTPHYELQDSAAAQLIKAREDQRKKPEEKEKKDKP